MSRIREGGNTRPDMIGMILDAIRTRQLEINTMMPAEVLSYDALLQTVSVQPSFKVTYINAGKVESRPRIDDVPILYPRSGKYGMSFPLAVGDSVALVFSQRSLDDWIVSGGEVQVRDIRLHDLTDAVAIPGLYPESLRLGNVAAGLEVRGDKIWIGDPDGVGAPAAGLAESELLQAIVLLINLMTTTPLVVAGVAASFDPAVKINIDLVKDVIAGFT